MWPIAVLLLIIFALLILSKIAETRRMHWVFALLAIAVMIVVAVLLLGNDSAFLPIVGITMLSVAVSDLIAIPIWKRRVVPPCVRVTRLGQSPIRNIISLLSASLFIALGIYLLINGSLHSPGIIIFMGLIMTALIVWLILILFEKIEICRNGVWKNGRLQPWDQYESFFWKRTTTDGDELRLRPKLWQFTSSTTWLLVPPEDRETVQHILEPNLPELTTNK